MNIILFLREQRATTFLTSILIGLSVFLTSVLSVITKEIVLYLYFYFKIKLNF